jgi:hypothetical protein
MALLIGSGGRVGRSNKNIYPLTQSGGLNIDYSFEISLAGNWLKEKEFAEDKLLYKKNKDKK